MNLQVWWNLRFLSILSLISRNKIKYLCLNNLNGKNINLKSLSQFQTSGNQSTQSNKIISKILFQSNTTNHRSRRKRAKWSLKMNQQVWWNLKFLSLLNLKKLLRPWHRKNKMTFRPSFKHNLCRKFRKKRKKLLRIIIRNF